MTPNLSQRAEEIVKEMVHHAINGSIEGDAWLTSNILAALRQTREEAINEAVKEAERKIVNLRGKCYSKVAQQDLKKTRQEVLEEFKQLLGESRDMLDHLGDSRGVPELRERIDEALASGTGEGK